MFFFFFCFVFFQAEDGIRDLVRSRGLGDVYKRQYQFYPAIINSHARLTYTEVAAILANTRGPEAHKRPDLVPHLLHLHEVLSLIHI